MRHQEHSTIRQLVVVLREVGVLKAEQAGNVADRGSAYEMLEYRVSTSYSSAGSPTVVCRTTPLHSWRRFSPIGSAEGKPRLGEIFLSRCDIIHNLPGIRQYHEDAPSSLSPRCGPFCVISASRGDHGGVGRLRALSRQVGLFLRYPNLYQPAPSNECLRSRSGRPQPGCRNFAILMLLARLGLRAGEVVALNLEDLETTGKTASSESVARVAVGHNFRYRPMSVKPLQPICGRVDRDAPVVAFFCATVHPSVGSPTPLRCLRSFAELCCEPV